MSYFKLLQDRVGEHAATRLNQAVQDGVPLTSTEIAALPLAPDFDAMAAEKRRWFFLVSLFYVFLAFCLSGSLFAILTEILLVLGFNGPVLRSTTAAIVGFAGGVVMGGFIKTRYQTLVQEIANERQEMVSLADQELALVRDAGYARVHLNSLKEAIQNNAHATAYVNALDGRSLIIAEAGLIIDYADSSRKREAERERQIAYAQEVDTLFAVAD